MLESVVAGILNRVLGSYVENFDSRYLNIGLLSGDVKLGNLRLKRGALDQLRLPVDVVEGHIGQLVLQIPYSNLKSKPVKVVLEDVFLLAAPDAAPGAASAGAQRRAQQAKRDRLEAWERTFEAKDETAADPQNFTTSLITKIVDNLQVTIKNIHVRYEDEALAAGVTLSELSAVSTTADWEPAFIADAGPTTHKLATLDALALYVDPTTDDRFASKEAEELLQSFRAAIGDSVGATDVVRPINGQGFVTLHKRPSEPSEPRTRAELRFEELAMALERSQYVALVALAGRFQAYAQTRASRGLKPSQSPSEAPLEWFKYAAESVVTEIRERRRKWTWPVLKQRLADMKEYMSLYRRRAVLGGAEIRRLETLEAEYTFDDLVLWRSAAKRQALTEPEASAPRKKTWGQWLWGGGEAGPTPQEREELLAVLDVPEHTQQDEDAQVQLEIEFSLRSTGVRLSQDGAPVASVGLSGVRARWEQRPSNYVLSTSVADLVVQDMGPTTAFREVVTASRGQSGSRRDDFFWFLFERNPLDRQVDSKLFVKSRSVAIVHNARFIEALAAFWAPPPDYGETVEAILNAANRTVEELRQQTRIGLEYALATHKTLDLQVDVQAPVIFVPLDPAKSDSPATVLDVGSLAMSSDLAAREAVEAAAEDWKRLEALMYDRFTIHLRDTQVLLGQSMDTVRSCLGQESSACHFLDKATLEFQFELSIVPQTRTLPRSILTFRLPHLRAALADVQYKLFMATLEAAMPRLGASNSNSSSSSASSRQNSRPNSGPNSRPNSGPNSRPNSRPGSVVPELRQSQSENDEELGHDSEQEPEHGEDTANTDSEDPQAHESHSQTQTQNRTQSEEAPSLVVQMELGEMHLTLLRGWDARPVVEMVMHQYELKYWATPGGTALDLSVRDLLVQDHLGGRDGLRKIAESAASQQRLFAVQVRSEDGKQKIDVQLAEMRFVLNPATALGLYDYVMSTFAAPDSGSRAASVRGQSPSSRVSAASSLRGGPSPGVAARSLPRTSESVVSQSEVGSEVGSLVTATSKPAIPTPHDHTGSADTRKPSHAKKEHQDTEHAEAQDPEDEPEQVEAQTREVSIEMQGVTALLVDEDAVLATLHLASARSTVSLGSRLLFRTLLGELSVVAADGQPLLSIEGGGDLADFRWESAPPPQPSLLYFRSGSLQLSIVELPLARVAAVLARLAAMKAVYDQARLLAFGQAAQLELEPSAMVLDVIVRAPTVHFQPPGGKGWLQAHLGEMYVQTAPSKQGESVVKLGIRGVHVHASTPHAKSESEQDPASVTEEETIVGDSDLSVDVSSAPGMAGRPALVVRSRLSPIAATLSEHQYRLAVELAAVTQRIIGSVRGPDDAQIGDLRRRLASEKRLAPRETSFWDSRYAPAPAPCQDRLDFEFEAPALEIALAFGGAPLSRFALRDLGLGGHVDAEGSTKAHVHVRSLTVDDTRDALDNKFPQIIPPAKHRGHQIMARLTARAGEAPAIDVSVDSPHVLVALDYLAALERFHRYGVSPESDADAPEASSDADATEAGSEIDSEVGSYADSQYPDASYSEDAMDNVETASLSGDRDDRAGSVHSKASTRKSVSQDDESITESQSLGPRVTFNAVDMCLTVLADASDPQTEAVVFKIDQVVAAIGGPTWSLSVARIGMFLTQMHAFEERRLRILDDFGITGHADATGSAPQRTINDARLAVEPLVLRLSLREIRLIAEILRRAASLAPQSSDSTSNSSSAVISSDQGPPPLPARPERQRYGSEGAIGAGAKPLAVGERLTAEFEGVRVVLIDPVHQLPMADVVAKPFSVIAKQWSTSLQVDGVADVYANVYSFSKSAWEPLVDSLSLGVAMSSRSVEVFSTTVCDVELTPETLALAADVREYFQGAPGVRSSDDGKPYRILNDTGVPVEVWSVSGSGRHRTLSPGQEVRWSFFEWRELRENLNATVQSVELGVSVAGYDPLESVAVNRVGEQLYKLSPTSSESTSAPSAPSTSVERVRTEGGAVDRLSVHDAGSQSSRSIGNESGVEVGAGAGAGTGADGGADARTDSGADLIETDENSSLISKNSARPTPERPPQLPQRKPKHPEQQSKQTKDRLVVDVSIDHRLKRIVLRSTAQIANETTEPIEIKMLVPYKDDMTPESRDGTPNDVLRLEPGAVRALPLGMVDSRLLIRPEGATQWPSTSIHWREIGPETLVHCDDWYARVLSWTPAVPLANHYPYLRINITAPLVLVNNLPVPLRTRLYCRDTHQDVSHRMAPGSRAAVHEVHCHQLLVLSVQPPGYERSGGAVVAIGRRRDFSLEDSLVAYAAGPGPRHKLALRLQYVDLPRAQGRVVVVYAPYLVLNRTGRPLEVGTRVNRALVNPGEVAMWSFESQDAGQKAAVRVSGGAPGPASQWSSPVSFDAVGSALEVRASAPGHSSELHLGAHVRQGSGRYATTRTVTLTPRFVLVNQLGRVIEAKEPESVAGGLDTAASDGYGRPYGRSSSFYRGRDDEADAALEETLVIEDSKSKPVGFLKGTSAHMAVRFPGQPWSAAFVMANVGTAWVRVREQGKPTTLVQVDVALEDATLVIRLTRAPEWPFSIRNFTGLDLHFYQSDPTVDADGESLGPPARISPVKYHLPPRSAMPYSWDFPAADVKELVVESGGRRRAVQLAEIGELPPAKLGTVSEGQLVDLQVIADGPTQALVLSDHDATRSSYTGTAVKPEVTERPVQRTLRLKLAGVGISYVSGSQELLYATFRHVQAAYTAAQGMDTLAWHVQWVQVDNAAAGATDFPVVLYPSVVAATPDEMRHHPTLSGSIARVTDQAYGLTYIKHATLLVQELTVEADEDFVVRALDSVVPAAADGWRYEGNLPDLVMVNGESMGPNNAVAVPELVPELLRPGERGDLYVEQLHLQPVQLNVSFVRTGALTDTGVFAELSGGTLGSYVVDALTMAIGNINDAPVRFNALLVDNVRTQPQTLLATVNTHYTQELLYQLHKIIGSADVFGNPVGLFNNISSGVMDLFYEPYMGYTLSDRPQELGVGLAKGGLSLMKKSVFGVSDSVAKVTGSLSKGLAAMTLDPSYQRRLRTRRTRNRPRHAVYGIKMGAESFYDSFSSGVTSLATAPLQGAATGGAAGFFRGLGRGLVGLPTKTAIGVLDFASTLSEGVRNTATVFDATTVARVRLPRAIAADGLVRPYNRRDAVGQHLLHSVSEASFATDRYVGHTNLTDDMVAVVSMERTLVASMSTLELSWVVSYGELAAVTMEPAGLALELRGGTRGPFLALPDVDTRHYMYRHIGQAVAEFNHVHTTLY